MTFQDGYLLYQKKFKIVYAQAHEITCLKIHPINIKVASGRKREIIILVGYFDGTLEVFHLNITSKSIFLKRILGLDGNKTPVTNILISKANLIISRIHQVQVSKEFLPIVANFIIN